MLTSVAHVAHPSGLQCFQIHSLAATADADADALK